MIAKRIIAVLTFDNGILTRQKILYQIIDTHQTYKQ